MEIRFVDLLVPLWYGIAITIFIVFLILRLIGEIDWNWWWVCSPIWGTIVTIIIIFIGFAGKVKVEELLNKK